MGEYKTTRSEEMYRRAKDVLAGGVVSVARVFPPPFSSPIYFQRGKGSHIWDVDGNEYVDYALGFGPLILGHCHPDLTRAIEDVIENRGVTFGICHDLEYEAGAKVVSNLPAVDQVRFTNTGTEAVMAALRLARGYTGKTKIVRFEGHYHGWSDPIHWNVRAPLPAIGLRHAPRAVPGTNGIPDEYGDCLIIQPWNDPEIIERTVKRRGHEIAAIITEPLMCNLGATAALDGYLPFLRKLCDEHEILLIFDEVITAFRVGLSGAQGLYGVHPDITTMAKALGGGYPVGAMGGRKEVISLMAQHGVSHAGTYNGNVLCMAAVKATVDILERPGTYEKLHALGDRLRTGVVGAIHEAGLPAVAQGIGPIAQFWFEEKPIVDYRHGASSNSANIYPLFAMAMYKRGVAFNPAQSGVWYISTEHSEQDIDFTIAAVREAAREIKTHIK